MTNTALNSKATSEIRRAGRVVGERIDWGTQALARWADIPEAGSLLTQRIASRTEHYSAGARTAHRIARVSCGRLPGGLLAQETDGRVSLTEIHREEGSSFAVTSAAGAGKSHLMLELIVDTLARGGAVHSLDAGNSHRALCRVLAGHQVVLDVSQPLGLSPFSNYHGHYFSLELGVQLADLLLEILAKYSSADFVRLAQCRGEIEAALAYVWQAQTQCSTIKAVLQVLESSKSMELRGAVCKVQADWAKLGPWLDGDSTGLQATLAHSFVVFDMDSLCGTPEVLSAVMMMLAVHSSGVLRSLSPAIPRLLVIEDADWYLRHAAGPDFWRELQSTLDDSGCGLGIAVNRLPQGTIPSVMDILAARSITVFLGYQPPESYQALARVAPWSGVTGLEEMARSLKIVGLVPQFVVMQYLLPPKVVRVELDSFTNLLISLRPADVLATRALLSKGDDVSPWLKLIEARSMKSQLLK